MEEPPHGWNHGRRKRGNFRSGNDAREETSHRSTLGTEPGGTVYYQSGIPMGTAPSTHETFPNPEDDPLKSAFPHGGWVDARGITGRPTGRRKAGITDDQDISRALERDTRRPLLELRDSLGQNKTYRQQTAYDDLSVALQATKYNAQATALALGCARSTFYEIRKHGKVVQVRDEERLRRLEEAMCELGMRLVQLFPPSAVMTRAVNAFIEDVLGTESELERAA